MAKWNIYKKNGEVLCEVQDVEYSGEWMGVESVSVAIESPTPVDLHIGDYIVYRGETFYLYSLPSVVKRARRETYGGAFRYSDIVFESASAELYDCRFLDYVLNDNRLHYTSLPTFSFYAETVDDLVDRLEANTRRGDNPWTFLTPSKERTMQRYGDASDERKAEILSLWEGAYGADGSLVDLTGEVRGVEISVDKTSMWEGLSMIKDKMGLNYICRGRVVVVGAEATDIGKVLKYGKGNGLYEIERSADKDQQVVTKLYAYGSGTNLPSRYYATLNLRVFATIAEVRNAWDGDVYKELRLITDAPWMDVRRAFNNLDTSWGYSDTFDVMVEIDGISFAALVMEHALFDAATHVGNYLMLLAQWGDQYPSNTFHATPDALSAAIGRASVGGRVYFTGYVNKGAFPLSHKDYGTANLPDNMAVNVLMLPGFPNYALSELCRSVYDEEKKVTRYLYRPTPESSFETFLEVDGSYIVGFSSDKYQPYITSPNIASLGVKEGDIHFTEDNDDNGLQEIHPSIEGMTAGDVFGTQSEERLDEVVSATVIEDNGVYAEGEIDNFNITLKDLGFDLEEAISEGGGSCSISMKDGFCGGRTFDVQSVRQADDGTWVLNCERAHDDALDLYFPYSYGMATGSAAAADEVYQIRQGDHYVLTGISLSATSYVRAASLKVLRRSILWLRGNDYTRYTYLPKIDEILMQREYDDAIANGRTSLHDKLKPGLTISFYDNDLDFNASIFIDQLSIKEGGNNGIPTYDVVLREEKSVGMLQRIQNMVGNVVSSTGGGSATGGLSKTQVQSLIDQYSSGRFLHKTKEDTAKKKITFEEGVSFGVEGKSGGIDEYADATLRNVEALSVETGELAVAPEQSDGDIVAEFGDTADGMLNGRGTLITNDGRVQTSTLEVRGTMKVLDLVASQIHSLNGYYYFTDTMKTEAVTECQITELTYSYIDPDRGIIVTQTDTYVDVGLQPHAIPEGATLQSTKTTAAYMLTFEKEHENDFLKFYQNDVLLSIMTDLSAANAERGVNETGNAMLKDVTSQSWMRVVLTTEDGDWTAMAGENTDGKPRAVVLLYPDAQVPGHVNSAPQAGYYVARRGNADTSTNATKSRQNSWCISVEEGRLDYYINQTRPVSGDENYAVSIGRLPDIKPVKDLGLEGEVGIYAKNLLVEHLYTVQWAGDVRYLTVDLGAWSAASAGNNLYYYKRETDGETSTVTYTNVQVSHNGYTWQSTATLTADGTEYIPDEPGLGSAGWVRIGAKHYYTTSETDNLDEGGVGMGAEEVVWFENQADLLSETNIVDGASVANPYYYCALRPYMWKKTVQSTSASTETETVELIGVYGETGTNYFIQSSHEYVTLDQDESSKTIALTLSFFTDNGGVRNPFECYCRVRMRKKNGDYSTIFRRFYGTGASDEALPVTEEDAAIEVYCNSSGEDMFTTWLIRKEIPVLKGAKGDRGAAGAIVRVFQDTLVQGFTYYAGEAIEGSSVRYKDFIVVPTSKVESGYLCLECKAQFTHTQATIGSISEAFSDDVGAIRKYFTSAQTEYSDGRQCLGEGYWSETSLNAVSAFFTFLVARNAFIRMLSGSQFVITDGQGKVLAGMGNRVFRVDENGRYEGEEGFDEENVVTTAAYYIWAGGESAKDAKFCVYADGSVKMNNGTFGGWLYHPPKLITGKNIKDYVYIGYEYLLREDKQAYESTRVWMLDYEKTGPCFVLYDEGATQDEGHIQSALIDLDVEQNGLPQNEATDILYLRLPWFASYVQCDTTAAGAVYRYDNGHVGATLDHMRKAYAMANCDIHIFNSSYSELYINGGVCLSPDSWSVPSDAPTILYQLNGDNNYLGTEFFATAKFCFLHNDSALKKEDYVGTALRWVEQDLGVLRQSTLMSRDHAKLIAEEE